MAKKAPLPKNERVYNIPLRKEFMKAPRMKRAKKAVKALRQFVARHMKSEEVIIGKSLNEEIWKRGIQHPPAKVSVICLKDGEKVKVDLIGAKKEEEKTEEKKKAPEKKKPAAKKVPAKKK